MSDAVQAPPPDIKRPKGRIPEWAYWLSALTAVGSFGGWAMLQRQKEPPAPAAQTIVTSSSIPDDFFLSPREPETAKALETAAKEEAEKKAEAARKAEAAGKLVESQPQKITARELFTQVTPVAVAAPPPPDPVEQFNESRREAGVAKVARAGRIQDDSEWVNKQGDWEEEDKTMASYPVDLSRVVTVNKYISAILKNAIQSELEGKVVAVIEENVYCAHGRNVCIPAGSEAVGRFRSLKKPGEERIPVIWSRIITPDGINIHLGDGEMSDAMGRAGITGDVDNRFMERYGLALLVSTLSAATAYAIPVQNQGQQIVIQSYGNNLSQLSGQILDKNINLKPTVSIPAGQRILISPNKDIWFPKPERPHVEAVALESLKKGVKK